MSLHNSTGKTYPQMSCSFSVGVSKLFENVLWRITSWNNTLFSTELTQPNWFTYRICKVCMKVECLYSTVNMCEKLLTVLLLIYYIMFTLHLFKLFIRLYSENRISFMSVLLTLFVRIYPMCISMHCATNNVSLVYGVHAIYFWTLDEIYSNPNYLYAIFYLLFLPPKSLCSLWISKYSNCSTRWVRLLVLCSPLKTAWNACFECQIMKMIDFWSWLMFLLLVAQCYCYTWFIVTGFLFSQWGWLWWNYVYSVFSTSSSFKRLEID